MELPYRFVAHRGSVNGGFVSYNYVLLGCMENGKELSWAFMNEYWLRSKASDKPVLWRLPGLLQVRVGEPVLSLDAIKKGQRFTNYVWYDQWTDNFCTFDYDKEKDPNSRFVCVLDKSKVPACSGLVVIRQVIVWSAPRIAGCVVMRRARKCRTISRRALAGARRSWLCWRGTRSRCREPWRSCMFSRVWRGRSWDRSRRRLVSLWRVLG